MGNKGWEIPLVSSVVRKHGKPEIFSAGVPLKELLSSHHLWNGYMKILEWSKDSSFNLGKLALISL